MGLSRTTITAPAVTSMSGLASGSSASCAAVTVGTTNNVVDHEIVVSAVIGAITASQSTLISLYAYGSADGTNWTGAGATNELVDGTDKAITLSANGNNGALIGTIQAHTASTTIKSKVLSLMAALGSMPSKYVIVATNSTGAAVTLTIAVQEIYY